MLCCKRGSSECAGKREGGGSSRCTTICWSRREHICRCVIAHAARGAPAGSHRMSKLSLVDLAGSEKLRKSGSSGVQLRVCTGRTTTPSCVWVRQLGACLRGSLSHALPEPWRILHQERM